MEPAGLIPTPESIPAPWGLIEFLGIFTLFFHLLFINVVLGGSLILLFTRLFGKQQPLGDSVAGVLSGKIPTVLAMAITFGVAPLLFLQVLYGHFFYSSSVLIALYWILLIPLLIIAYYGAYIHARKHDSRRGLSLFFLALTCLILLWIAFIFENNISLMLQPGRWTAYFGNRDGTLLNLSDPVIWPRYLHFVTASVAVAGIFSALLWSLGERKGVQGAADRKKTGLKIFAFATMVQIAVGLWLLIALPENVMMQFMGRNKLYTVIFGCGFLAAVLLIVAALQGSLVQTLAVLVVTIVLMLLMRFFVRTAYLDPYFKVESLEVVPQYDVLILFVVILLVGLGIVWYMLKTAANAAATRQGRAS